MDTIKIVCDSVATYMNSMAEGCQPIVKVAETNCADVRIVLITCCTIIFISIFMFILIGYYIHSHYANQKIAYQYQAKQPEKTDSEKAIELLDNLANKVKNKEGKINNNEIIELFKIYTDIKKELNK